MENNKVNLYLTLSDDNNDRQSLLQEISVLQNYLTNSSLDLTVKPITESTDTNITIKGDPFTLGALLIVIAPTLVPQLLDFVEKMTIDKRKIELEAPNGAKVVLTPNKKMTEDEVLAFVRELNKIKKSK